MMDENEVQKGLKRRRERGRVELLSWLLFFRARRGR